MKSDEKILAELKKAAEGLYVMSESDYPLEVICWEGSVVLSQQYLRELHGNADDTPIEVKPLDGFSSFVMSEMSAKGEAEPAGESRYRRLTSVLRENLTDVKVYRVGKVNIPVYVVGRSASGNWLGLSTRVVET